MEIIDKLDSVLLVTVNTRYGTRRRGSWVGVAVV